MKRLHCLVGMLLFGLFLSNAVFSGSPREYFDYYVLTPTFGMGVGEVMSLENNNLISSENIELHLEQYETGVVPGGKLLQGVILSGTGPFSIASDQAFTNLPVPESFAGNAFVLPKLGGIDVYSITSPYQDVWIELDTQNKFQELFVPKSDLIELDIGPSKVRSGIIRSDGGILVAHHRKDTAGELQSSYPVPPAATEL